MNTILAMKSQLAAVKPAAKKAKAEQPKQSLAVSALITLGAVPSNLLNMVDIVKTSYQYHEAVRKGEIN